jgi:hypothetical protein
VRAVARGETYLSPAVSKRVVDDYVSRTGGAAERLDVHDLPGLVRFAVWVGLITTEG